MPKGEFVSRAGLKLAHALDVFQIDPRGLRCADFGCNAGGFTDCLLRRGALQVIAVDTGYGMLDWGLRNDTRVEVHERRNVLHMAIPAQRVDLVVIDMAWTQQKRSIPVALRWLAPHGLIVALIKPHYEASGDEKLALVKGVLSAEIAARVVDRVLAEMPKLGAEVVAHTPSPLEGGGGNAEHLVLLTAAK
ncbi:MAG: methyltransferase domain-containing protein [Phycisphaerales bacterium]|nr:methyltransferase domain-containing protein [Phycisphaerales bacterium]